MLKSPSTRVPYDIATRNSTMPVVIRPLTTLDRDAVLRIVSRTGNFTDAEIDVAMELVDEWLAEGEASGYVIYVLADDDASDPVRGYVCFGPAPMTDGTFDLYWIAVDPVDQGRGFGRRLLTAAEEEVRARRGRLLLIETASQASYAPTIRFYERSGYTMVSRIRDYYRRGDDKLVFAKHFAA
jgi:ribosomal protein S18 acetylase RimI-like enzyme